MELTRQQRRLQQLDPNKFPTTQLFILGKLNPDGKINLSICWKFDSPTISL